MVIVDGGQRRVARRVRRVSVVDRVQYVAKAAGCGARAVDLTGVALPERSTGFDEADGGSEPEQEGVCVCTRRRAAARDALLHATRRRT